MMDEGILKEIKRRRVEESRLYENYVELAKREGKDEHRKYASSAEDLHANFYHGWMDEEEFEEKVREVEELRKWLIELLEKFLSLQKLA